jgi:hypothetical protein
MLVQLSDPLLKPILGSWKLDPLSMQVVKKIIPAKESLQSVEKALAYARSAGNEEIFMKFLQRCQDDRVVIAPRSLTFHHHGKKPYVLPIQKVEKEGRKVVIHAMQKPPFPVAPVAYIFHFHKERLVMTEKSQWTKPITHKFYTDKL